VFEAIRKAKPPRLYIAADGPRADKPGEAEKVEETRRIANQVDWVCEVKTLFREKNLGCRLGVSSGIDWFFANEEEGIILEDDCLPSQSFFWFCEELLEKYKNDVRIAMITGTSYLFNEIDSENDYFFSKYISIWGWASWRRAWQKYDANISDWPNSKKEKVLDRIFYWDSNIKNIFSKNFDSVYEHKIDTWDYQWCYKCLIEGKYCITPYKNMISNIGFEGTRSSTNSPFINMKRMELLNIKYLKQKIPVFHELETDQILFYNVFYRFQRRKLLITVLQKLRLFTLAKRIKGYMYVR
jgi:hypothetical protein